ncbi:MAG: BadF/BadG/BcrA/BcrD ATPase family protein, partial [Vulcanimicrobiaceae bacterium]
IRAALQAAFPAAAVVVEDDTRIALRAGVAAGPGIALIAGTGAVAYGEHDERRARVGGAGYLLGDEGSAFAIGLAACKLLARTLDGRARADETSELVKRGLHAADRDGLLAAIYDAPLDVARIAALATPIVAFAGKGNRASTKIVQAASLHLADLVKSAAQQVDLIDRSPAVVLAGGLLRTNSLLTFLLETRIAGDLPGAQIVRHDVDPALGALRLAATLVATT